MTDSTKFLDPVQGLIDYVNDIKPYHTKVIETLVEYVGQENIDTNIREKYLLNIGLNYSYNIPFNETYVAYGTETIISTTIPTYSGNIFIGSPPIKVYNFNNTVVYLNGVFQEESTGGSPPTGDYIVSGGNEITFINQLTLNDKINIYTATQWQDAPNMCNTAGYGSSTFDDPDKFPIVSPNPGLSMVDYPAMTSNSFIIIGDQREKFNPANNTTFQIESFTEDVFTGSKVLDTNNNGTFTVANSIFTVGNNNTSGFTTVFILGIVLVPPSALTGSPITTQYVSLVSLGNLTYTKILSYSNVLNDYVTGSPAGSPPDLLQDPDEGTIVKSITNLSQSSPYYFIIDGDFRSSNIFNNDTIEVLDSTTNDGTYTILSMTYNATNDETTIEVPIIPGATIDGSIQLNIPSNVFFVSGNYTPFFKQGAGVSITTGTALGTYTTLNSKFVNNETQIRVVEDIITGTGDAIVGTTGTNAILVAGNQVSKYPNGSQLNIVSSVINNGLYTVVSTAWGGVFTTITVTETLDLTDTTGTIHKFIAGSLSFLSSGFGQVPALCEIVPDTVIKVGLDEAINIDYYSSGSPAQSMFQYFIVNTTDAVASPVGVNTISVYGDATTNINNGASVEIIHSSFSPSNNGTYVVNSTPVFNETGNYTTFNVSTTINNVGNSGGWIEGIIT